LCGSWFHFPLYAKKDHKIHFPRRIIKTCCSYLQRTEIFTYLEVRNMTWLDGYRMRLVLVGVVAAIGLSGGSARADFTFGEPTNLGPVVNFSPWHQSPFISADGLSLYFSGGPTSSEDLWMTERNSVHDDWGKPTSLGSPINTSLHEFGPSISPDGLELYFHDAASSWGYTPRPGGLGECDIWVSTRPTQDHPWTEPKNLGGVVNSSYIDENPKISSNGLSLYFSSDRPGSFGRNDIWIAQRATPLDRWGEPVNLGSVVNSEAGDSGPSISADGLALFFNSDRSGGYGLDDLYMTTRSTINDPWGTPVNLGPIVNTANYGEVTPCISADGRTLYFGEFPNPRPGGYGRRNIWQSSLIPIVDFTGDYQVDIEDLTILIEHWGQNNPAYDMGPMPWGDGVIDKADLEVLMSYWGQEVYDPNLLARWKMDETEGDVAYDSAAENDAIILGDAIWEPVNGKIDGALQLDGADDYIQTPYILDPAHGSLAALLWIKGGVPGQVILSQENGANWLMIDTEGRLATEFKLPGMSMPFVSGAVITDGDWHRMGVVWDGTHRILNVDGVQVLKESGIRFRPSQGGLHIGAGSDLEPATFFSGMIDDVRIYDRVVEP
jgi:hypothetical protein